MPQTSPDNPKVCAIVLNWNRPDDTIECLNSLLPMIVRRQLALVVCDNRSCDDSVERICNWGERHFNLSDGRGTDWDFLLVQTGANLGFAGGNNVGIHYALKRPGCRFIWILNNDTVVREGSLEALLECAQRNEQIGIFGSTLVDYYAPGMVQLAGGCRYRPLTTIVRPVYAGCSLDEVLAADAEVELDYVSGAAMFCRAEVFRQAGLFDERFFLYYEELDLAHRARAAGCGLGWCKGSIVCHKGAVSTGGRSSVNRRESWQSNYHENLSTLLYTRKHHPWLLPIAASLRFAGKMLTYLVHGRLYLISALLAAYRDAGTARPPRVSLLSKVVARGLQTI